LKKFGNEREGFSIERRSDCIVVSAHGFWSANFADQFVPAVVPALLEDGRGTRLTLELAALRPLRNEGQAAFKSLIVQALAAGTTDLLILAPSALTKLQMLRIVREIREQSRVRVE
jgi:hypothetical protein